MITFFACCSINRISKTAAADDDQDAYRNQANDNDEVERDDVMEQTDNEDDDMYSQHAAEMYNSRGRGDAKPLRRGAVAQSSNYHSIECIINGEYSVTCQQDGNGEVYLPFKFISKYFEVLSSRTSPTKLCNVGQFNSSFVLCLNQCTVLPVWSWCYCTT